MNDCSYSHRGKNTHSDIRICIKNHECGKANAMKPLPKRIFIEMAIWGMVYWVYQIIHSPGGGFLSHGGFPSHRGFQYQNLRILDDSGGF